MFTGITQGIGHIHSVQDNQGQRQLVIQFPAPLQPSINIGASVAVNGTCLTVTKQDGANVYFDVIKQTLHLTNLGQLHQGDAVNLERSLKYGDEIGGHLLSGHVTTKVLVSSVDQQENNVTVWIDLPDTEKKYILPQGFIGLNGCSLTIAMVEATRFAVCLIPETLSATTFGQIKQGDTINMEIDQQTKTLVSTVERMMPSAS